MVPAHPAAILTRYGEGLGLNIISRILDRHNGTIRLESKLDRGAAFYVALPKA